MRRFVRRYAFVTLLVTATVGASFSAVLPAAQAAPISTATFSADSTTDLAAVSEVLPALQVPGSLVNARIGHAEAASAAQPQSATASASNLDATVDGLGASVQTVTETAPQDDPSGQAQTFGSLSEQPLVATQVIKAFAQARSPVTDSCLASGVSASAARTSTAGVTVGKNVSASLTSAVGLGDIADVGAMSSADTTSLVSAGTGVGDPRAVESRTTATVGPIALLDNAIAVGVVGTPSLTARATGVSGTSSATYTAPHVTVSVNSGSPSNLNTEGIQYVDLDTRVGGTGLVASVTLSLGTIQNVVNTGTAVSASASVLNITISLTAYLLGAATPLTTTTLAIAPMTVASSAPSSGVQCPPASGAPAITSPGDGTTVTTNEPAISGTGTTGDTVTITAADGTVVCGPTAVTAGTFTCSPTAGLPQGSVVLTATDTGGLGATASIPVPITVGAASPPAPVIASPTNGALVNNATLAFSGTGIAGDTVKVMQAGTVVCAAVVTPSGAFSCSPADSTGLGTHTVSATQDNPGPQLTSPASNQVAFTTTIIRTQYTALKPYRILDTRTATRVGSISGPILAGHSLTLTAEELRLANNSAVAVVINLTIVTPLATGHAIAYPSDQSVPVVSSVNFAAGHNRANLVIVPVSADGSITIYTSQTVQVVVDVFGFFASRLESTSGGLFHAITPARLVDTRLTDDPLAAGATRVIPVAGLAGVPDSGASAAVLNVTVARPTVPGFVAAFPSGTTFDGKTSNVNFDAGDLASTRVIVPLGTGGAVSIYNRFGTTPLVVDVVGYTTAVGAFDNTGSHFVAVDPVRRIDSRVGTGTAMTPLGANETRTVQITGTSTVPTQETTAVAANLTAVDPTGYGYLIQLPNGLDRPVASDVNFTAGQVAANLIVSGIDGSGSSEIYNSRASVTDFVEDIYGYFTFTNPCQGIASRPHPNVAAC